MDKKSFYIAANEIGQRHSLSPGAAQTKLRELCASGLVRSWRQPYSMVNGVPEGEGPPERIEPIAWRRNEIDLMTDADGCSYFVDVSMVDLDAQLGPTKRSPRDAAIIKRLQAGEQPPDKVPWKKFCDNIRDDAEGWIDNRQRPALGFSNKQIQRAVKAVMDK